MDEIGKAPVRAFHYLLIYGFRFFERPVLSVLECRDLRCGLRSGLVFLEQHVIGRVGIERRVEVHKIHGCVVDFPSQDVEMV